MSLQLPHLHIIHLRGFVYGEGDHAFRGMGDAFAGEAAGAPAIDGGGHLVAFDGDAERVPLIEFEIVFEGFGSSFLARYQQDQPSKISSKAHSHVLLDV